VGEYSVLIINRRLSHCRHPLLGQQHPAPCLTAWPLVNYPGCLCINCMWPAFFSSRSRRNVCAINGASHQYWSHCRRCVDAHQSRIGVGVDLYAGLEFWMFFQPQSQGVDLYADRLICGNIRYIVTWKQSASSQVSSSKTSRHPIYSVSCLGCTEHTDYSAVRREKYKTASVHLMCKRHFDIKPFKRGSRV